jgi:hypothetical protein
MYFFDEFGGKEAESADETGIFRLRPASGARTAPARQ